MKQLVLLAFAFSVAFTSLNAQLFINGKVVDSITGIGLDDCVIEVKQKEAPYFTFDGGKFKIPVSDYGLFDFTISKENYGQFKGLITVGSADTIEISLSPASLIDESEVVKSIEFTDEVIVRATRVQEQSTTTSTTVSKEELQKENLGQDLPYLLEFEPSVVVTSDAGAGVGYTSMRIRGSDMSRINFTINGVPYNDPESQGVFLVNVPDLASSVEDIQIQRGVGTSTNGAGAFGASVNINTNTFETKPYAEFSSAVGSFSTFKNTLNIGSGLINDHFTFDGRLSRITSDGYIDRASTSLWSYYLSGAYKDENTIIRFNHFSGKEITYQSWNGVDATTLKSDRTFNSAGTDFFQKEVPYDNEVDNYKQDHYQFFVSQNFSKFWTANIGLHYTKGAGYFEQYKVDEAFTDYNLPNPVIGNDTVTSTDLIRRRWLDNDFYGFVYSLNYNKLGKIDLTIGGAWNQYDGDHFGEIIWAQNASNSEIRQRYYDNNGLKTDFNAFAKIALNVTSRLVVYGDLQYRNVGYNVAGIDNDQRYLFVDKQFNFINPKFGLNYLINSKSQVYSSFAVANREPTRNDFIDAPIGEEPLHESMTDFELGYRFKSDMLQFNANYYWMNYDNQLVLTGALNDVGSLVRENVTNSYRMGIEGDVGVNLADFLLINSNLAWSINEIKSYNETNPDGTITTHTNTKIAYSPQWVGAFNVTVNPHKTFSVSLLNKFVGKQFLDNTSNNALALDRYVQNDIRLSYHTSTKLLKELDVTLLVNNYTNHLFESNGYVYFGEAYFFPQAGTNFMLGLRTRF